MANYAGSLYSVYDLLDMPSIAQLHTDGLQVEILKLNINSDDAEVIVIVVVIVLIVILNMCVNFIQCQWSHSPNP